ncbi:hypothetical protein [uncultured Muribaculum sp.]
MALQFHASWFLIALMVTEVRLHQNMKKIIAGVIVVLVAICAYAQQDVTQFLGIPVDGSKSAMIQKLKAKGFHANSYNKDVLEGKFNGMDVNIHIATNGDKVCRIMVCDANNVDERSIQIRFNRLIQQFEKNPKYMSLGNELIPDDEDISYNISVKNKRYEAIFYQQPAELSDTTLLREKLMPIILKKYTAEELANPTEEMQKELMKISFDYMMDLCSKKPVWFMISELYGKYYITMFYDNEYNRANGEDL